MKSVTYSSVALLRSDIARNYPLPVDSRAVGRNLRAIRTARKESQETVAARMGVVQEQVSAWERGRYKSFDLQTLFRLANGYAALLDDLLLGVDGEYDRRRRDLLRQTDQGSSSAVHSQTQQEGEIHEAGDAQVRHALAEELREAATDFSRALQDVADRLDRGVAGEATARKTSKARERKAAHVRATRKMG